MIDTGPGFHVLHIRADQPHTTNNTAAHTDETSLPTPDGNVTTLWRVNPRRWIDDGNYATACAELVARYLPHAHSSEAEILTDETGATVITAHAFWDADRQWFLDPAGRVASRRVVAPFNPDDLKDLP